MGLTPEQVTLVQNSWELVKQDFKKNSMDFFFKFFQTHPEYQNMFQKLKGLSPEELKESPKMRAHASIVFHSLSSLVASLDDPDSCVEQLQKNVKDHKPRGLTCKHYEHLGEVLVAFLADRLGPHFTSETEKAWGTTYGVILSVAKEHLPAA